MFLSVIVIQIQKCGKTFQFNTTVVFGNNANVVLRNNKNEKQKSTMTNMSTHICTHLDDTLMQHVPQLAILAKAVH